MSVWDRKKIGKILVGCAVTGQSYFRKAKWRLKADKSLVTDADTEIEEMLAGHFDRPELGLHMIGEETVGAHSEEYIASALSGTCFVVDPIDGTAPFAHGIPTWGIMIGHMSGGRLVEGGVILPSTGELVISDRGTNYISIRRANGSYSALKPFRAPSPPAMSGGLVCVSQNIVREWKLASSNPYQAICCSAFTSLYLIFGRYLAYAGCSKLWDVAAVLPILWNAGFTCRFIDGRPLTPLVDEGSFHLGKDDRKRWSLKDQIILSGNPEIADYVQKLLERH